MTGIDPFTIYQNILTERYSTKECPLMDKIDYREPMLFKNKNGKYYNGKEGFDQFDALIYHPRTRYVFNRPDWLVNFPGNKIIDYEVEGDNYPYLVKAYRFEIGDKSVPIDIIQKEYNHDNTGLVLPSGDYIIKIVDRDRKVQVKNLTVN